MMTSLEDSRAIEDRAASLAQALAKPPHIAPQTDDAMIERVRAELARHAEEPDTDADAVMDMALEVEALFATDGRTRFLLWLRDEIYRATCSEDGWYPEDQQHLEMRITEYREGMVAPQTPDSEREMREIQEFEERLRIRGQLIESARLSLIQRVREFVEKHGRNGSKTGREDYSKVMPLSDIETLRIALDEYDRVRKGGVA